jgi:hypothetical protein
MSDWIDESQQLQEAQLAEALAKRAKVPVNTGFCLACDEPTKGAFCSPDCKEDYEHIERINRITGKKKN